MPDSQPLPPPSERIGQIIAVLERLRAGTPANEQAASTLRRQATLDIAEQLGIEERTVADKCWRQLELPSIEDFDKLVWSWLHDSDPHLRRILERRAASKPPEIDVQHLANFFRGENGILTKMTKPAPEFPRRIVLQPAADNPSQQAIKRHVLGTIPLSELEPHLESEQKQRLTEMFPEGQVRLWGVRQSQHRNEERWARIQPGDIVLFAFDGGFRITATILGTMRNAKLAEALWGLHQASREPFEFLYFLSTPNEIDVPYSRFNGPAGYRETNRSIMDFRVLDPEPSARVLAALVDDLSSRKTNYWWVNQGWTFEMAHDQSLIWAPRADKAGHPRPDHVAVMDVKPGDRIFHYSKGGIRAVGTVKGSPTPAPRPPGTPQEEQAWKNEGYAADVHYTKLWDAIPLEKIPLEWRNGERPFDRNGDVKQGYLYPVSSDFAQKMYSKFQLPHETPQPTVEKSIDSATETKASLTQIAASIRAKGLRIDDRMLRRYHLALNSRGFVILAGISGTGKTWLAQEYARAVGAHPVVVAVAPNWTSNEDLLGYVNLSQEFISTEFSRAIKGASDEYLSQGEDAKEWHLILDEMNLARVEYYFAKFLSALELRQRERTVEIDLAPGQKVVLTPNLRFIGTVNIDETTHNFSDKVYDRAQLIVLDIKPEDVEEHLNDASYREDLLAIWRAVREVAPFGYRVLDDIRAYVAEAEGLVTPEPSTDYEARRMTAINDALDEQLLQKVLPKVKGADARVGLALAELIRLTEKKYPLTHGKARSMQESYSQHEFASFH